MITDLLSQIQKDPASDQTKLQMLIDQIRPARVTDWNKSEKKLVSLTELLKQDEALRQALQKYILNLFAGKKYIRLLTESGIHSNDGFFKETSRKFYHIFLPPIYHEIDLTKLLNDIFSKRTDFEWVEKVDNAVWMDLLHTIFEDSPLGEQTNFQQQVLNSVLILSQRITSIGIEPAIIDKIPELEEFDSPFFTQNKAILKYLEQYDQEDFDRTSSNPQLNYIFNLLYQCEKYVEIIRINRNKFGASLNLTYMLQRLTQNIKRIRMLLKLLSDTTPQPGNIAIDIFKELVKAENKKHSFSEHFSSNIDLLAFQITEHAGKTGEHYITTNRKDYRKMFRSSMGGGFIVGFLTMIKTAVYYLHLPLFGEAFLYSMNYSLGFIGIHVTRSTLATKQPAMTATKIAGSLDLKESAEEGLNKLADMIVRISRSQIIALLGNVIIAFPVAYVLATAYFHFHGEPFADPQKAWQMIKDCSPIESPAIFHAAIAGVYLFLAGLISGYYDNKNVYYKIAQRLKSHKTLTKVLGAKRLEKFAGYIDKNLGSLAGNFFLGIFLGSTAMLGTIFGLPLDIRHITFSSGTFGIGMATLQNHVPLKDILISIGGIFSIGFVNLFVSFGLAIFVAIKSRKVNFKQSKQLLRILFSRFRKKPLEFFWPPKDPIKPQPVPPPEKPKDVTV
ncbi:site-specific recombinase [Cytophagaceae bacterium ABcell3]|nr:site-specific recombinase [Cytophagaceae bacterium ABcell3]